MKASVYINLWLLGSWHVFHTDYGEIPCTVPALLNRSLPCYPEGRGQGSWPGVQGYASDQSNYITHGRQAKREHTPGGDIFTL